MGYLLVNIPHLPFFNNQSVSSLFSVSIKSFRMIIPFVSKNVNYNESEKFLILELLFFTLLITQCDKLAFVDNYAPVTLGTEH